MSARLPICNADLRSLSIAFRSHVSVPLATEPQEAGCNPQRPSRCCQGFAAMSAGKAKNLDSAPTDPGAPQYLMSAR